MIDRSEELINELYRFAVQHARASASQATEADDFLQEILVTFLAVGRRYSQLGKGELVKVAKTAARNRIRDLVRNRNVRFKYHVSLADVADDAVLVSEEASRLTRDLLSHLSALLDRRGRAVVKNLSEGYTVSETACLLDTSGTSIGRMLKQARLAVEIMLEV